MRECKVTCLVPPVHLPELHKTLEYRGEVLWLSEADAMASPLLWRQARMQTLEAHWEVRCRVMREPRNPAPPYMRRKTMHPGAAIPVPEEPKPNLDEITKAATQAAVAGVQQELAKARAGIAETLSEALQNFVGQQKSVDVVDAIKQAVAEALRVGAAPVMQQPKAHQVDDSTPTFIPENLVKKGGKKLDMQEDTSVDPSVDEAMLALRASRKKKGHKQGDSE